MRRDGNMCALLGEAATPVHHAGPAPLTAERQPAAPGFGGEGGAPDVGDRLCVVCRASWAVAVVRGSPLCADCGYDGSSDDDDASPSTEVHRVPVL